MLEKPDVLGFQKILQFGIAKTEYLF